MKGWHKRRIQRHAKKGKLPLEEIEMAVKAVVDSGAKHYGLPANAKERRM